MRMHTTFTLIVTATASIQLTLYNLQPLHRHTDIRQGHGKGRFESKKFHNLLAYFIRTLLELAGSKQKFINVVDI